MHSSRGCEPRRRRTSQPHRLLCELRAEESASGWPVWNPTELCEIPASHANGRGGGGSPRFLVPLHVDAVGRAPAEQPAAAGGRRRSRSRLFHSVLCTKLQHTHDLTCSSSTQEAAPVSHQAHALLDSDGNGEGLGQQHSELLPCLRHVGVSRGTVLLPNSTVTTSGCVRWRGGLELHGGRSAEAELPPLPLVRPVCKKRECPATVYYAHLATLHAKHHIASKVDMSSSVSESSGGSRDAVLSTVQYVEAIKVMEALQATFYFVWWRSFSTVAAFQFRRLLRSPVRLMHCSMPTAMEGASGSSTASSCRAFVTWV
ncbi:uncharacterized protein LOC144101353 [Amblyomma americanum]